MGGNSGRTRIASGVPIGKRFSAGKDRDQIGGELREPTEDVQLRDIERPQSALDLELEDLVHQGAGQTQAEVIGLTTGYARDRVPPLVKFARYAA